MNFHKIFRKTMLTLLFCTPLLPASDTSAQDFFTKLNGPVSVPEPKQILSTSTEESNTIQKLELLNRLPYRTLKHLVKYYNPEDTENNNEISYKFEDRQKTYSSSISQETFDKFITIAIATNNSTLFKVISEYKVPFNTNDVSDLIQYLSYAKRNGISGLHLRLEPEPTTQEPNYTLFDFAKKRKGIAELELDLKKPNEKKALNLLKILCSVYADLICTLDASDLNIEDEGADAIASETRLTNLKHLDLTFNKIKNTGAQAIISALHLKTIKSLKLTWNQIQSDALISFESANHLENLKSIDLGWNQIQDEGVKALLKFPHLSNLEDLGLHENNIGNEGAEALAAAAIHLKSLKYLNLSRNNIGNEGAKALAAAAIHLKSLKYLNLSQNNIGNEGVEALRMTNLIIDISSNPGDNRNEDFSRIKFPKRWIELNKDWM